MYNGRQRHIQTESLQDQSAKEESVHGHRKWGKRLETCQEQSSWRQKQNTWQREKCTRSKRASARHEKKINHQCNVTFGSTVVN